MSLKLEDYDEALRDAAPEIRDVLEATFQEASRVMSPAGLEAVSGWCQGAVQPRPWQWRGNHISAGNPARCKRMR